MRESIVYGSAWRSDDAATVVGNACLCDWEYSGSMPSPLLQYDDSSQAHLLDMVRCFSNA